MKKLLAAILIGIIISLIPSSFAQDISISERAEQRLVVVISAQGAVHVQHIVESSQTPKQILLMNGTESNLQVTDEQGNKELYGTIGEDGIMIFPSNSRTIVEYDLDSGLRQENDTWIWDIRYLGPVAFIFPEGVDWIYVNERPVVLADKKGIMCHGCQMKLEYTVGMPKSVQEVNWEDKKFFVEIQTFTKTSNFVFDQPKKSISFDIDSRDEFVNVIVPLELLWGPYEALGNDEKILVYDYINNGTHVWLNMKPDVNIQEITIVGTTVVPEFPLVVIVLSAGLVAIIPLSRKFNLH